MIDLNIRRYISISEIGYYMAISDVSLGSLRGDVANGLWEHIDMRSMHEISGSIDVFFEQQFRIQL